MSQTASFWLSPAGVKAVDQATGSLGLAETQFCHTAFSLFIDLWGRLKDRPGGIPAWRVGVQNTVIGTPPMLHAIAGREAVAQGMGNPFYEELANSYGRQLGRGKVYDVALNTATDRRRFRQLVSDLDATEEAVMQSSAGFCSSLVSTAVQAGRGELVLIYPKSPEEPLRLPPTLLISLAERQGS